MMLASTIPWDLRRRGLKDSIRHDKRIKEALKQNLKDLIAEETIITSDGRKKVKIPIKYLDQYRFKYGEDRQRHGVGQGPGAVGDIIATGPGEGPPGPAGDQPGEQVYEAEVSLDDLTSMMLEDFALPWLEQKDQEQIRTTSYQFNDLRKKGQLSNLDKRRTLMENLKRNAVAGSARVANINDGDLRYKVWEEREELHSNCAVYLLMDRSGSMTTEKKYIAKSFFFWLVRFLQLKYKHVEMVFIAHDTEARIVPEKDFFIISNSGGTKCSSAYQLALDDIRAHHPRARWNSYVFHFSDGDNYSDDNELCKNIIGDLLEQTQMVGYGEINELDERIYGRDGRTLYGGHRMSTLHQELASFDHPHFVTVIIRQKEDVYRGLQEFLKTRAGGQGPGARGLGSGATGNG
ncbi:MAG: YeaH/YhbH family protein [Chloroflexota bacterium]